MWPGQSHPLIISIKKSTLIALVSHFQKIQTHFKFERRISVICYNYLHRRGIRCIDGWNHGSLIIFIFSISEHGHPKRELRRGKRHLRTTILAFNIWQKFMLSPKNGFPRSPALVFSLERIEFQRITPFENWGKRRLIYIYSWDFFSNKKMPGL